MHRNQPLVFWYVIFGASISVLTHFFVKWPWNSTDFLAVLGATWVAYVSARETYVIMST